jgi:flagellar motor switch protein FliN/FliY
MSNDTPMDPSAEQSMADDWAQALEEQTQSSGAGHGGAPAFDAMDDPFASVGKPAGSANDINMVLDIPVQLSVELGRTKVPIKYILQLGQGSVVELDALAGEPMDVLVNGYLIAQGEVVVVNDKFGIRLTDIVTPSERLKRLSRS